MIFFLHHSQFSKEGWVKSLKGFQGLSKTMCLVYHFPPWYIGISNSLISFFKLKLVFFDLAVYIVYCRKSLIQLGNKKSCEIPDMHATCKLWISLLNLTFNYVLPQFTPEYIFQFHYMYLFTNYLAFKVSFFFFIRVSIVSCDISLCFLYLKPLFVIN